VEKAVWGVVILDFRFWIFDYAIYDLRLTIYDLRFTIGREINDLEERESVVVVFLFTRGAREWV
jgi:hypothetical protein